MHLKLGLLAYTVQTAIQNIQLTNLPILDMLSIEKEKNMTMTKEILEAMHYPEHSGGRTEVDIQTIKDIIQKYDSEGFEAFDPFEGLE